MKLPLNFAGSGGGNGFYSYGDSPFDSDIDDIDNAQEISMDNTEVDFTEYLWMENEEEFDKIEWQRLEEEELMQECLESMLEEESNNDDFNESDWSSQIDSQDICQFMAALEVASNEVENSTLNPLAKEFVPSSIAH